MRTLRKNSKSRRFCALVHEQLQNRRFCVVLKILLIIFNTPKSEGLRTIRKMSDFGVFAYSTQTLNDFGVLEYY